MSHPGKRIFLGALVAAVFLTTLLPTMVRAEFPERPIRLIVPGMPASSLDLLARMMAPGLGRELGQTIIVDNKPGASTIIAAQALLNTKADGYTLMLSSSSTFTLVSAMGQVKLTFDPVTDFEPIASVADAPLVLAVHSSAGINSMAELVAAAKKAPGKFRYASFGAGSGAHFAGANFEHVAGVKLGHVAYKGGPAAMNGVLGGEVPLTINSPNVVLPHIQAGVVKPLVVTSPQRWARLPNVPTMSEAGYPEAILGGWMAFVAPRGTPAAVISRLQAAIAEVMKDAPLRTLMLDNGFIPAYSPMPNWKERVMRETEHNRAIVKSTGLDRE